MNTDERQLIQGLFDRLGQAERTSAPRDATAEAFIREHAANQPAAAYYMAQTIIVQEEALKAANARIEDLERTASQRPEPATGGGGFLGNLFGGGGTREAQRPMGVSPGYGDPARGNPGYSSRDARSTAGPWGAAPSAAPMGGRFSGGGGGGFLAGAAQTAVGVAGGVMLGSMLGNLFDGSGHSFLGSETETAGAGGAGDATDPQATGADDTGPDASGYEGGDVENADFQDMGGDDLGGFDEI